MTAEHTLVQILEVLKFPVNDSELLWGLNIDAPDTSYKSEKYEILFAGWILGKKYRVVSVELMISDRVIQTIPVNYPRPDVAQSYTEASYADHSGFLAAVDVSELPMEFELLVQAVFFDGTRLLLSKVTGCKKLPFLDQVKLDLARSKTRLQHIQTELVTAESSAFTSKLDIGEAKKILSIQQYASRLSDQEWFETLTKSVDCSVVNGIELPGFPSEEIQRNTVGSSGAFALHDGFRFYSEIKQYATKLGHPITRDSHILDFGCGWGRIIRFFLKEVAAENLYGVDVHPGMIDICTNTVRYGNYSVVQPEPPTKFSDNTFDVIYAFSVFSHLSESVHIKWVEEFSRLLKPGGLLIVTTQARQFIEFCRSVREQTHQFAWYEALANSFLDTEAALADYDNGKFLFSATGGGEFLPSSFYGEAVIPPTYIKQKWTQYLNFCDFVDDPSKCYQAYIVMQKPGHNNLQSQIQATKAEVTQTSMPDRRNASFDVRLQSKSQTVSQHKSTPQKLLEKLLWKEDRVLLDDLVFRLEHGKNSNWELGEECFILYKPKDLIDQYKRFLTAHPDFQPQNIFELGMWEGGSVAFWSEIFKPNKLIALDLRGGTDSQYFQKYVASRGLHDRLKTYWNTNQADSPRLREIINQEFEDRHLDLVIDDASHFYELTKISFETLFPLLRPGSFYIIEDWAWWHWQGLEAYYVDRVPLSQLVFELVEAAGTSANLIKNISIYQSITIVERGDASLEELGDFKLDNYIYRHPKKPA